MLDIKFVKRVINNQMLKEDKLFLKKLFNSDIKLLKKELKEKEINAAQYMNTGENAYDFLLIVNQLFYFKMEKVKEKAWKFLNNEKEAIKAGWYQKSEKWYKNPENQKKLWEWYEKANPVIDNLTWENEINQAMIINYLKLN